MKFEWEQIKYNENLEADSHAVVVRAKVFGGWIVKSLIFHLNRSPNGVENSSQSMVFIPDPNHEWRITDE